ncbi:MAG: hypothetical protein ABIJ86_00365 [Spirochaetota bacterium]
MSPETQHGYPGYEQELDSLLVSYGSEAFTRSLLQVYTRDCPLAMIRLMTTISSGDLLAARKAIHSLANIMGIVGPISSRPMIETISADLNDGQLKAAARHAEELETLVQSALVSIHDWLGRVSQPAASNGMAFKGND